MGGIAFSGGAEGQKLIFGHTAWGYFSHRKAALSERAGFVENEGLRLRKLFEIVRALYHDAMAGGSTDTAEIGERHGNDQRTWAGHHKEGQRTVHPVRPSGEVCPAGERRLYRAGYHRKGDGAEYYDRGIDAGKFCDEILGFCLVFGGILHQLKNTRNGGIGVGAGDLHPKQTVCVDAAAYHLVALVNSAQGAFTGEGGGVKLGRAGNYSAVKRNALSGADNDYLACGYLLGGNFGHIAVTLHVGKLRVDVNHFGNGAAGFSYRYALEKLSYLIEYHYGGALGVFTDHHCAD